MRLRQLAVIVAACLPLTAPAQVYKWVDAQGVTHYGQKPPASANSQEVELRDPTGGPDPHALPPPSAAEMENGFRQRQAERKEAEAKQAAAQAQRQQNCMALRDRVNGLSSGRRVYTLNDRGERVYLTDGERNSRLASAQADYARNCP